MKSANFKPTVNFAIFTLTLILFGNSSLMAEQMIEKDGYQIHYNVFNSSMLTPKIATQYGIQRVKNRAILNISVLDKDKKAVTALVSGEARNATSQLTSLKFRKIAEGEAIYYLAIFKFVEAENLDFTISVVPDGETSATKLSFKQQLFLD